MDEGWTRWIIETYQGWSAARCIDFRSIGDKEIRSDIDSKTIAIVFPDQSPNQILRGFRKGSMPEHLTGGLGEEGVAKLRKFVEGGGTLVFFNRASDFAIKQFNLPVEKHRQELETEGLLYTRFDFANRTGH